MKPIHEEVYSFGTNKIKDQQIEKFVHKDVIMYLKKGKSYQIVADNENFTTIFVITEPDSLQSAPLSKILTSDSISDIHFLTMILSTYPYHKRYLTKPTNQNLPLDIFLKETNGWLVYQYQLEHLYIMAANSSTNEAIFFRKKFNARYAELFKKDYPLFGTTLLTIFEERIIYPSNHVLKPQFNNAYRLLNYLNS